ncbi:MFS transporter [Paenibacillus mendelii]|uniref:MFS transporter n=1 Tax=Paenibacillus mendelii TaxID=206163 RepID=A0ABV6J7J8_9BACL|nr:MFS transporter [Paenibacillus mendelii]MCQ6562100.1 MFS transporter [Paenibacillus mendelii]
MKTAKTGAIIALSSVPLMMTLGNSMLIPILPELSKKLGVSSFQISMIISVYSIIAILLIPLAGYLSDRWGRKKIMIPSLCLAAVGGLVSALAASMTQDAYWIILLGRLLQGAGAAGAAPIVFPLTGDLFKSEKEVSSALGLVETANTFGKVLSPILGALLAWVIWYLPFYAIPLLSMVSVVLLLVFIHIPKQEPNEDKPLPLKLFLHNMKPVFREKGKWLFAVFLVGGTCMFAVFAVLFYLSDRLETRHHIEGIAKGALLAIPLSALCLSSYLTGKWIGEHKKRMKWLSFISLLILTLASIGCAWLHALSLVMMFVIISAAAAGIGAALPCMDALITEGIEKQERGTVTSLYSSMRFIGVGLGPPVASLLMSPNPSALFYTIAGIAAITAIIALVWIKPGERKSATAA